jgi:hypothetical protein
MKIITIILLTLLILSVATITQTTAEVEEEPDPYQPVEIAEDIYRVTLPVISGNMEADTTIVPKIVYKDEDGTEEKYDYANENEYVKVYFGDRIRFEVNDYFISFKPSGLVTLTDPTVDSNTITYSDFLPDSFVSYTVEGNKLKEYIILKEQPSTNTFQFEMKTNFELREEPNGEVSLIGDSVRFEYWNVKEVGTSVIATMLKPFAVDSNNNYYNGSLDIAEGTMTVIFDEEDLKNAVYPIMIDPTLATPIQAGFETGYGTAPPEGDRNFTNASVYIGVGSDGTTTWSSGLDFNISVIPNDAVIQSATIGLYVTFIHDPGDPTDGGICVRGMEKTTDEWIPASPSDTDIRNWFVDTDNGTFLNSTATVRACLNVTDAGALLITMNSDGIDEIDSSLVTDEFSVGLSDKGLGATYYIGLKSNNNPTSGHRPNVTITYSFTNCTCAVPINSNWIIDEGGFCTLTDTCNLGNGILRVVDGGLRVIDGGNMVASGCYVEDDSILYVDDGDKLYCG